MISQLLEPVDLRNGNGEMPEVSDAVVKQLVQTFKLLSDETRLRILFYLSHTEELHVRALCDLLGQSQPAVSHHLALLRVSGLIEPRRQGKHNFYRILPEKFEELLEMTFSTIPNGQRQIHFDNFVLSFLREEELADLASRP